MTKNIYCKVCGLLQEGIKDELDLSFSICDCCGLEFEVDDCIGGTFMESDISDEFKELSSEKQVIKEYRKRWLMQNLNWQKNEERNDFSWFNEKKKPENWNREEQIKKYVPLEWM